MTYSYKTKGTCSSKIDIVLNEDHIIENVTFTGGCNGNLKGVSSLVVGQRAEDVIQRLSGIICGMKGTSCPDQLSKALTEALAAI